MSLRPLLRIAAEDERFRALATAVASGDGASVRASASIRPYLLAALLDDPDALAGRPALVVATADIAVRGGILDVFAATEDRAARIELFGDEVEQIRWFSTFTQRSLGEAERLELAPAAELALEHRERAEVAMAEEREAQEAVDVRSLV